MQLEPGTPPRQRAELATEDHEVGLSRRVQVRHVTDRVGGVEMAEHAHDRGDAAAGGDEQELLGRRLGQHEVALDSAERHDRARPAPPHQVRGHLALIDTLDGHADQAIRAVRIGGQRVRAPMSDAVDIDADAQELPRPVTLPAVARLDQHGRRVRGLVVDPLDTPAQLPRGPQRVDQLQVVVGQQRRAERLERPQHTSLERMNVWGHTTFGHLLRSNFRRGRFRNRCPRRPPRARGGVTTGRPARTACHAPRASS